MAAICAVAGLIFNALADPASSVAILSVASGRCGARRIATVSFVLTVEQRRWLWSLGFAWPGAP